MFRGCSITYGIDLEPFCHAEITNLNLLKHVFDKHFVFMFISEILIVQYIIHMYIAVFEYFLIKMVFSEVSQTKG